MAVFQLPTDGIADGAITTAKINASVSLGASVNVILDGTDGGGSNAGDNLILDGTLVEFRLPFDCVIVALLPATVIMIIFLWPTKRPAARVSVAVPLPVFRSDTSVSLSNALEPPAPVIVSVDEP